MNTGTRPLGEAGDTDELVEAAEEDGARMLNAERAAHIETSKQVVAIAFQLQAAESSLAAERAAISQAIGSVEFMDPPDGGSVTLAEQVERMREALAAEKQLREQAEEAIATQNGVIVSFGQRVVELTAARDGSFEKYAAAVHDRDAARLESEKADDETRVLKHRIRTLELVGTQEEAALVYRLRADIAAAETQMRAMRAETIEECARIAINNGMLLDYDEALYQRKSIAAAIRALAPVTTPPAETGD